MDTNDWKLFWIHRERRPKELRLELGGLQCALGFLRTEIGRQNSGVQELQEFRRVNKTNIDFELTSKTSRTIDRSELLSLRHSFLDFSYQHDEQLLTPELLQLLSPSPPVTDSGLGDADGAT